jgi:hypothetical protein
MSELSIFNTESGIELVINTTTGEAFATQAGYSRMSGANKSTISMRMKGVQDSSLKQAEIVTGGGMQRVQLIPAKLVFKWLIKDNPELAAEMGEVGATVYLHKMAGYKVTSTAVAQSQLPQTYLEALKSLVKAEEERQLLQAMNEQLEQENQLLAEAVDELFDYSSIIRIAKFNGCDEKVFNWRKLKTICTIKGLEVKQVPCPRFGTKNLYPHDAWRYVYPEAKLPETTTLAIR